MVILKSSDGHEFEVEEKVVTSSSVTIRNAIETAGPAGTIPLSLVDARVLRKVIEFWNHHHHHATTEAESAEKEAAAEVDGDDGLEEWDTEFGKLMTKGMVFDVLMAASYLDSKQLLHVMCKTVVARVEGMSVKEILDFFAVVSDFTKEEEAHLLRESRWAQD